MVAIPGKLQMFNQMDRSANNCLFLGTIVMGNKSKMYLWCLIHVHWPIYQGNNEWWLIVLTLNLLTITYFTLMIHCISRSVLKSLLSFQDSPGYLDLVAVGTDTSIIQRLLLYGASFAPRVIIHNSSQPLLVSIRKDPAVLESYTIDGKSFLYERWTNRDDYRHDSLAKYILWHE